jgi:multiple sugar transport system substrate-binding protein
VSASDALRVALVGGPMYDRLYARLVDHDVEVVVHEDHPTLNRRVAEMLGAGARIDVLATHSKYAPSQRRWLRPLDDLLDPAALAPLAPDAVELCRFRGALLCAPRLIDVRILWSRTDRVAEAPDTWAEMLDSEIVFGFPGRESGLFGTFFELVVGAGGRLFDEDLRPTMATPEAEWAIETLCALAARAPDDLPGWHYDEVDAALLDGRLDAAAAWPGAWGAIRECPDADLLRPSLYPAGPTRRVSYSGCHAWAVPTTCGNQAGAVALITDLLGQDSQHLDAAGGTMCAHTGALADVEPTDAVDRRRLDLTRATIADAMITYPPLARFPDVEDAGWSAINAALVGDRSAAEAAAEIQAVAARTLATD